MEKCRRMQVQQCMSKSWWNSSLLRSSKIRQQSYRTKSFAMNTDTLTRSKTTSYSKRDQDSLQHEELRSYCGSRLVKFVFWIFINFKDTFKTRESFLVIFFHLVFVTYTKWNSDSRTRGSNWEWHLSSNRVNNVWWKIGATWHWPSQ